jgi:hypothetical protein
LFISATPQTPITLGQPLEITLVVQNTGTYPWLSGELPSWIAQIDNPSWSASWPFLNYASYADVDLDEQVSVVATLDPADLPAVPGQYSVRLNAAYNIYDIDLRLMSGSPKTVSFSITSGNQPPVLGPLEDQWVIEGTLLSYAVPANDPDGPSQTLSYNLEPGAPAGAAINRTNGLFTWTPPINHTPTTNWITVRAADDGSPPLSATNSFNAVVVQPPRFEPMTQPVLGAVTLNWRTQPGMTYRLQYKDNLSIVSWINLGPDRVAQGTRASATNNISGTKQRFYRVLLLDFTAGSN